LALARPRAVLLVCHAASSPDRGTERFLREVLAHCGECRLWPAQDVNSVQNDSAVGAAQRWIDWLQGTGLERVAATHRLDDALQQLGAAP
jgi:hypothetical protein